MPRKVSEETPRRPVAYQLPAQPLLGQLGDRRTPARMIWELKPPARPRSAVTSSSPTFVYVFVLAQQRHRSAVRAGRRSRLARHALRIASA